MSMNKFILLLFLFDFVPCLTILSLQLPPYSSSHCNHFLSWKSDVFPWNFSYICISSLYVSNKLHCCHFPSKFRVNILMFLQGWHCCHLTCMFSLSSTLSFLNSVLFGFKKATFSLIIMGGFWHNISYLFSMSPNFWLS